MSDVEKQIRETANVLGISVYEAERAFQAVLSAYGQPKKLEGMYQVESANMVEPENLPRAFDTMILELSIEAFRLTPEMISELQNVNRK